MRPILAGPIDITTNHRFLSFEDSRLWTYNSWDIAATRLVRMGQRKELAELRMTKWHDDSITGLLPAVLDMQRRGLRVDQGKRTAYRKQLRAELSEVEALIVAADPSGALAKPTAKYHNGINARERVAKVLYDDMGLKSPRLTESGKRSVDQDALLRVLRDLRVKDRHAKPLLENLLHRSRLNTIDTRYLGFRCDIDGRLRARVKMAGTETFRYAYADPALQQFPEEARSFFVPDPGNVFVAADCSQLEARILAVLAPDQPMLEVFASGGDVHALNAEALVGADALARNRKAARNLAKTFLYGLMYGGSAETMNMKIFCPCPRCADKVPPTLDLSPADRKQAEVRWFAAHPNVPRWREKLVAEVAKTACWRSALGAVRWFCGPVRSCIREIYNTPIQTTAAEIIRRHQKTLYELGAPICLQMHDNLMLEVPRDEARGWAHRMKEVMEQPIEELGGAVFPVDLSIGDSWKDLEEWKT